MKNVLNKVSYLGLIALAIVVSVPAFAEGGGSLFFANGMSEKAVLYVAGILGVSLAAFGGTAAQSRAASVALEGIARNPSAAEKLFTPLLLSLALMESLVIFT